jgi:uncharacterized protein (DUF1015 family)
MASIKPFAGYYANPANAEWFVSPPYDALTPQERYAYANAHPANFLNAMRSLDEFPPAERPDIDDLLHANRAQLRGMIDAQNLLPMHKPAVFLYRMAQPGHQQIGVIAEVPVSEYERGLIKKHENTQRGKENDLVNYLRVVGASTSPICLAYPAQPSIDVLVSQLAGREPLIDFVAPDGVAQTVWQIDDEQEIAQLAQLFARVPAAYLTDGHHRAAAAAQVAAERRRDNPDDSGEAPYEYLLTALFPDDQLRILEYNRCVDGSNGHSVEDLLAEIAKSYAVERLAITDPDQARPEAQGQVAMFLDGNWYCLTAPAVTKRGDDPVASLDVTLLQKRVLEPALGIGDPRSDPRLRYMSAAFKLADLERLCREHNEIAFALHPTSIADLIAVADAGATMPPKSTWFDPKMRSGLFVRLR